MKRIMIWFDLCLVCCAVSACTNEETPKPTALISAQHAMINGKEDKSVAHNAVVGLYLQKNTNKFCKSDGIIFCTGTLIHPKWVLTAAHCVTEMDGFGGIDLSVCNEYTRVGIGKTEQEVVQNLFDIKNIYYSKDYQYITLKGEYRGYETVNSDIALIELEKKVPTSLAKPILPHPKWLPINRNDLKMPMVLSGYGFNENGEAGTKLKFTIDVADYCGQFNSDDGDLGCSKGKMKLNGCHPNKEYAAKGYCYYNEDVTMFLPRGSYYYTQESGGPCQGDSGGPGFFTLGGVEYISGVSSFGDIICGGFGVSTAIEDYYDWIIATAPDVASQYIERCDNKLDDDGNGMVDCEDDACVDKPECGGNRELCNNGKDDNDDGLADCDDPMCIYHSACNKEICDNHKDDNKNGLIDCDDPQCKKSTECIKEICNNNKDDNKDGLADCDDPQCKEATECTKEICDNNLDDNKDGLADCNDPQCKDDSTCQSPSKPDASHDDKMSELCSNQIDDNGNGIVDCDDPQCFETCHIHFINAVNPDCSSSPLKTNTTDYGIISMLLIALGLGMRRRGERQ